MDEKELNEYLNLSIHDLTRRSTSMNISLISPMLLSIHDLTRRSTRETGEGKEEHEPFNSRPHKEVDYQTE